MRSLSLCWASWFSRPVHLIVKREWMERPSLLYEMTVDGRRTESFVCFVRPPRVIWIKGRRRRLFIPIRWSWSTFARIKTKYPYGDSAPGRPDLNNLIVVVFSFSKRKKEGWNELDAEGARDVFFFAWFECSDSASLSPFFHNRAYKSNDRCRGTWEQHSSSSSIKTQSFFSFSDYSERRLLSSTDTWFVLVALLFFLLLVASFGILVKDERIIHQNPARLVPILFCFPFYFSFFLSLVAGK